MSQITPKEISSNILFFLEVRLPFTIGPIFNSNLLNSRNFGLQTLPKAIIIGNFDISSKKMMPMIFFNEKEANMLAILPSMARFQSFSIQICFHSTFLFSIGVNFNLFQLQSVYISIILNFNLFYF